MNTSAINVRTRLNSLSIAPPYLPALSVRRTTSKSSSQLLPSVVGIAISGLRGDREAVEHVATPEDQEPVALDGLFHEPNANGIMKNFLLFNGSTT